jgi:hypothetical protein
MKIASSGRMTDTLNPDVELERLAGMHDTVVRLREQIKQLKEKQSDLGDHGSSASGVEDRDSD